MPSFSQTTSPDHPATQYCDPIAGCPTKSSPGYNAPSVVEPLSPVIHDGGCCSPDTIDIFPAQFLVSPTVAASERLNVPISLAKAVRMLWCVGLLTGYVQCWVSFDPADPIRNAGGVVIGIRNGFPMLPQVTLPAGNEHVCFGHSDDITAYFVGSGVNCLPLILEKPVTKMYAHLLMA